VVLYLWQKVLLQRRKRNVCGAEVYYTTKLPSDFGLKADGKLPQFIYQYLRYRELPFSTLCHHAFPVHSARIIVETAKKNLQLATGRDIGKGVIKGRIRCAAIKKAF
jgi:hypothetical protein